MDTQLHVLLPSYLPRFEPVLRESLLIALGEPQLEAIESALSRPLNVTSLRTSCRDHSTGIDSLRALAEDVCTEIDDFKQRLATTNRSLSEPLLCLSANVILIPSAPAAPDLMDTLNRISFEVCVHRLCAESVLRGSDIFIRGVGMASKNLVEGSDVIISTIPHDSSFPNRGSALEKHNEQRIVIGWGKTVVSKAQLLSDASGLGVKVYGRFYSDAPPLNGVCMGRIYAQHIPSIYAMHIFQVEPNDIVLDMCASPGGKTSRIAEYLTGSGIVVAVDRTKVKVQQLLDTCIQQNVAGRVYAIYGDAAKLLIKSNDIQEVGADISPQAVLAAAGASPATIIKLKGFYPESFDKILLDPSCSALGLRPKLLLEGATVSSIEGFVTIQRRLLWTAVHLLKVGGVLMFSTCTITPQENEENVAHVLKTFDCLRLIPCGHPIDSSCEDSNEFILEKAGEPGLAGCGLNEEERLLVRRFNPAIPSMGIDTTGFFLCKIYQDTFVVQLNAMDAIASLLTRVTMLKC